MIRALSTPCPSLRKSAIFLPEVLIFCLSAVLLFANLGVGSLWEDEAETALLGKNILAYGLPIAYDGKNIISQEVGRDYDGDYLWRWSSWGDKYAAALSMRIFGETTSGARFLFALLGFLSVVFFYITARQIFPTLWGRRLATLFYCTSVPFLLHARQCRYYSLVLVSSVLMLFFLSRPIISRRHWIGFAAASFILFHSNYFLGAAALAALLVTVSVLRLTRRFDVRPYLFGIALAAAVSFPGFLLYRSYPISPQSMLGAFTFNIVFYLRCVNDYCYPALLWIAVAVCIAFPRKPDKAWHDRSAPVKSFFAPAAFFIMTYLMLLSLGPFSFFRYMVPLFPLFAILLALSVSFLAGGNAGSAALLSAILLLTNLLSVLPGHASGWPAKEVKMRSLLYDYLYEQTHERTGPIDGLVAFFRKNAKPGDVLLITYGDLPLKFYTSLEVHGGLTGEDLRGLDRKRIRWIIARQYVLGVDPKRDAGKDAYVYEFIRRHIDLRNYVRIVLDVPDTPYENREDPGLHIFRAQDEDVPKMVIFKRRDPSNKADAGTSSPQA